MSNLSRPWKLRYVLQSEDKLGYIESTTVFEQFHCSYEEAKWVNDLMGYGRTITNINGKKSQDRSIKDE